MIDQYISEEIAAGKLRQITSPAEITAVHTSSIGIIPKPHQPGKFRLIVDLSSPQGHSVNDGIHPGLCSLQYASVDQAAAMVNQLGKGAFMAKLDLKSAYRMQIPKRAFHKVRLNVQCRADIAWWSAFLQGWNGTCISYLSAKLCHTCIVADASGSWGCGAFEKDSLCWFQIQWPQSWQCVNIVVKEMLPLVVGAAIWGSRWEGHRVSFLSDNLAVVNVLTARSAKDPHIMHLLRCLFFFEAHFKFEQVAQHVPGKMNTAADAISRNRSSEFHSMYPQAQQCPSSIPHLLLTMVLRPDSDLDISKLEGDVLTYFARGLSPSTMRTYKSAKQRYLVFCQNINIPPLPLSEYSTCLFAVHLAQQGLSPQSISAYMSAVRHL